MFLELNKNPLSDCLCKNYKIPMVPMVVLNNGLQIPQMGLGSWLSNGIECTSAIREGIDVGYRLIDTAELYSNEKEIGQAIKEEIERGTTKRSDIIISTKLWNTNHKYEDVLPSCKRQIENFGLDYIDIYLMHWPVAQEPGPLNPQDPFDAKTVDIDFTETWRAMEECLKQGLVRSIGVSNFNSEQLQKLLDNCRVKPVINQIEVHLLLNNKKLIKFCKDRDIEIVAYMPLGSPGRSWQKPDDPKIDYDQPIIKEIAEKYQKSGTQVALRYLLDIGVIPIPKSSKRQRLIDNKNVFDFKLTNAEIAALDELSLNFRFCAAPELKDDKNYPFNIEF